MMLQRIFFKRPRPPTQTWSPTCGDPARSMLVCGAKRPPGSKLPRGRHSCRSRTRRVTAARTQPHGFLGSKFAFQTHRAHCGPPAVPPNRRLRCMLSQATTSRPAPRSRDSFGSKCVVLLAARARSLQVTATGAEPDAPLFARLPLDRDSLGSKVSL